MSILGKTFLHLFLLVIFIAVPVLSFAQSDETPLGDNGSSLSGLETPPNSSSQPVGYPPEVLTTGTPAVDRSTTAPATTSAANGSGALEETSEVISPTAPLFAPRDLSPGNPLKPLAPLSEEVVSTVDLKNMDFLIMVFAALLAGAGIVVVGKLVKAKVKSSKTKTENPCAHIQQELITKKAELVVLEKSISLQEKAIEELKAKMSEKISEKIEEKKEEVKAAVLDKTKEIAGFGEETVVGEIFSSLENVKDTFDEVKGNYDTIKENFEKAQSLLEALRGKLDQLKGSVEALESSYRVCMVGVGAVSRGKTEGVKLKLPKWERKEVKATIVENSLLDKKILDEVNTEKMWQDGDWTLYNVRLDKIKISDLQKALRPGPWYVHFWQEGSDFVQVVFKEKAFTIRESDKATWLPAIAYGKSIGIPESQLDFKIPTR